MRVKILRVRTAVIYCVILLASALCVSAQQRPLLTDDIDITPAGALEISAGVEFFQDARFPLSGMEGDLTRLGNIRIKSGIAPNVELQLEGVVQDYVSIDSISSPSIPLNISGNSTHDFGDIIVSAKIKLRNEKKYLPAIGLKFGFEMPNTDQAKGIGTNQINIFSKILVQKKFGSVVRGTPRMNLMGNIGIGLMSAPLDRFSQNDVILYGLAGIYRVTDHINIVSEINGRSSTRRSAPIGTESQGQVRIGAQFRASGLRFDTAAAFGITRNSPRTGVIFGVTYVSPSIFTPAK
ncbi:MAG TPA: hypothetical protein PKC65_11515 [Pyrinomonadaceae bacterium]|nr:hypothetical protein [Pyrinomonadaceae bacterium]